MSTSANGSARGPDEQKYEADDEHDDADGPEDRDAEQKTQDQQNCSEGNHAVLLESVTPSGVVAEEHCTVTVHSRDDCPWGPRLLVGPVTIIVDQLGWPSSPHACTSRSSQGTATVRRKITALRMDHSDVVVRRMASKPLLGATMAPGDEVPGGTVVFRPQLWPSGPGQQTDHRPSVDAEREREHLCVLEVGPAGGMSIMSVSCRVSRPVAGSPVLQAVAALTDARNDDRLVEARGPALRPARVTRVQDESQAVPELAPAAVVRAFLEEAFAGRPDASRARLHPEVVIDEPQDLPYGGRFVGHAGIADLAGRIGRDFRESLVSLSVMDTDPVVTRLRISVTSLATKRTLQMDVMEAYEVADGLITHIDIYYKNPGDIAGLLES